MGNSVMKVCVKDGDDVLTPLEMKQSKRRLDHLFAAGAPPRALAMGAVKSFS